jgi:hypothetical protein
MQIAQGNSLYSYLYLKQAKMSCFSFYLFFFFPSTKLANRRAEQVLPCGVGWHQWEGGGDGERVKEGEYGARNVYTFM